MREFAISGTFEAEDIDDALAFLAAHFAEWARESDDEEQPATRICHFDIRPTLIK